VMSTGLRSFQLGHLGGSVCGRDRCEAAPDADLFDACALAPITGGAVVDAASREGCPVWRRPSGERFFFVLLDERTRTVQVGLVQPESIPSGARAMFPALPPSVSREVIDDLLALRLPER